MFTRIFGKTTFLSYFIAFLVLIAAVFWHHKVIDEQSSVDENAFKTTIIGILAAISLLCIEWTVRKQKLYSKGSYHLLVFALFFWILPINKWDIWLWVASLFFWFSFLQIIKSDERVQTKKAIFNAGFWMVFAIFFQQHFFYFFLTLWLILYFRGQLNFKNILLTLIFAFCIAVLWTTLLVLFPDLPSWEVAFFTPMEFSFLWSEQYSDNISFVFLFLTSIVVALKYLKGIFHNSNKSKNSIYNMILFLISTLIIILFGGEGNVISWVSFLMVIAVLSTQYFESFSQKWPVELFFVCCLAVIFQHQILSIFN